MISLQQQDTGDGKSNFADHIDAWHLFGDIPVLVEPLKLARQYMKRKQPLLISGDQGVGKAWLAQYLCKSNNFTIQQVSALHPSGAEQLNYTPALSNQPTRKRKALPCMVYHHAQHINPAALFREESPGMFIALSEPSDEMASINNCYAWKSLVHGRSIHLPNLRELRPHIPLIVRRLCQQIEIHMRSDIVIERGVEELCQQLEWSRNLIDLQTILIRAFFTGGKQVIGRNAVQFEWSEYNFLNHTSDLEGQVSRMRTWLVFNALERHRGNQSAAARALKVTPQAVHQFIKQRKDQSLHVSTPPSLEVLV